MNELPEEVSGKLTVLAESIEFDSTNNEGANGYVFFGRNRLTGQEIAAKFYYWGGNKDFHAEPSSLTKFDCKFVLKILDAGYAGSDWAYFLTPFCVGGSLEHTISERKLGCRESIEIVAGILEGLSFLHAARLLHRDVKPGNIFMSDGRPVIGDFGSVAQIPDGQDSVTGSKHALIYTPPESILSNTYDVRSDIYQTGIILYQLIGGSLPYSERAWLTGKESEVYDSLCEPDNAIYAKGRIRERITAGKILDFKSIYPWVDRRLVKAAKDATHVDPGKRYASVSQFVSRLNALRPVIPDWGVEDGYLVLQGKTTFRIPLDHVGPVQKRRTGPWKSAGYSTSEALPLAAAIRKVLAEV